MIALLTDFGTADGYVGTMKGVISGICPEARVVDLTHEIPPQDLDAARFVLWNSYKYFPKGSIFVCVVDPGVGSERPVLAVQTEDYVFLAPENGLLDFVLAELRVRQMLRVENPAVMLREVSRTFHGRDIFSPVAAHLESGFLFTQLGPLHSFRLPQNPFVTFEGKGTCEGHVLYVDRFGNLITNIKFTEEIPTKHLIVHIADIEIEGLSEAYADVEHSEALAILGSHGLLEISVRNGSAKDAFRVDYGAEIRIEGN